MTPGDLYALEAEQRINESKARERLWSILGWTVFWTPATAVLVAWLVR